jgi:hypothetical protein
MLLVALLSVLAADLPDGGDEVDAGVIEVAAPVTVPAPAAAVDVAASAPVATSEPAKKLVEATGYVDSRSSFTRAKTWGLVPTDDLPQLQELVEFNAQVKVKLRERTYLSSDVSLIGNVSGEYHGRDANGADVRLDDHNSAQGLPVVSINELFLFHEFVPQLNVVLGKKRVVWGPGLAINPTDLLNPRRDPTDPTLQRSGSWLAEVEAPFESMTFSLLFAPTQLASVSGIPTAFVTYPTWNKVDDLVHFQAAARWYLLVKDADVNVMAFYGNSSIDAFRDKFRLGLTFSRYFFTDYELHAEALIQQGSARQTIEPACVDSTVGALACVKAGTQVLQTTRLNDHTFLPKVLVGTKRQFSDDSLISLEYLYQADGWDRAQFQAFANGLSLLDEGRRAGLPVNRIPGANALLGQSSSSDGLPARVNFDPRGQHYLFLTFQKPRIFDDFTASIVVIANLTDFSTIWSPSLAWSATEWLTLTLYAFVPLQGPDSLAVTTPSGTPVSEFSASPYAVRALLEARVFF